MVTQDGEEVSEAEPESGVAAFEPVVVLLRTRVR